MNSIAHQLSAALSGKNAAGLFNVGATGGDASGAFQSVLAAASASARLAPMDAAHGRSALGAAAAVAPNPSDDTDVMQAKARDAHQRIEEQARKWVAQTFFGTMLKQMRSSPFKSDLFSGGRGGQAFGEMLDQRLVDHMSKSAGRKIVDPIVRRFEAKKAYTSNSLERPAVQPATQPTGDDSNPFATVRIHVPTPR